MEGKSCENCQFWKLLPQDPEHNTGLCQRHAPTIDAAVARAMWEVDDRRPMGRITTADQLASGFWPLTMLNGWCGEYDVAVGYCEAGEQVLKMNG